MLQAERVLIRLAPSNHVSFRHELVEAFEDNLLGHKR